MALTATIHRFEVGLSDVDRNVYETLDLRVARHPSETARYMLTRVIAYALSYEDGIAFSKGGLSSADEPPISIHDPTGLLTAWIDVGSPSGDRLHKASKAAPRVAVFTSTDLSMLRREVAGRTVHKVSEIAVHKLETSFLDAIEAKVERHTRFELVRTDGQLYATIAGASIEGTVELCSLVEPAP